MNSEDDELAEKEQSSGGNDLQGEFLFEICQPNGVYFCAVTGYFSFR